MNSSVIIDMGVPFMQLPTKTLKYFNSVYTEPNCVMPKGALEAHCGCIGDGGYGGMPNIDFRTKDSMKFSFVPEEYMSTPAINYTTHIPYCNSGIVNYWLNSTTKKEDAALANNAGFGSVFLTKFGFYQETFRSKDRVTIGFLKGEDYEKFVLILGDLIWYVCVIGFLSLLTITLSWKKYNRIKSERALRARILEAAKEKGESVSSMEKPHLLSKEMRSTMRRMDFTSNMGDYNAILE